LAKRAEREAQTYVRTETPWDDLINVGTTTITDERKHREALKRAKEMRVKQNAEAATLGRTFARDADRANAFSKLSHYETAIERQIYRALHELERRQAAPPRRECTGASDRRRRRLGDSRRGPLRVWVCFVISFRVLSRARGLSTERMQQG
jgi:hypothetical protein